jgi:hypothetical protein
MGSQALVRHQETEWRFIDEAFRHAAEHPFTEPAVAIGSGDDQIGIISFG